MDLDPIIWKRLPCELTRKIILLSKPSIDTRLYFNIPPGKIDEDRLWRLWYLLKSHDGLVYCMDSRSLHIFRMPGHHLIRRNVSLDHIDDWFTILNQQEKEHVIDITEPDGKNYTMYTSSPFYTEFRVKIR